MPHGYSRCGLLDDGLPVIMSSMEMNGLSPILHVYVSGTLFFTLDCFSSARENYPRIHPHQPE